MSTPISDAGWRELARAVTAACPNVKVSDRGNIQVAADKRTAFVEAVIEVRLEELNGGAE